MLQPGVECIEHVYSEKSVPVVRQASPRHPGPKGSGARALLSISRKATMFVGSMFCCAGWTHQLTSGDLARLLCFVPGPLFLLTEEARPLPIHREFVPHMLSVRRNLSQRNVTRMITV